MLGDDVLVLADPRRPGDVQPYEQDRALMLLKNSAPDGFNVAKAKRATAADHVLVVATGPGDQEIARQ